MAGGTRILCLFVLYFTTVRYLADCREVACYKCSWTGSQDLDEEKEKQLDDTFKEMSALSTPIDNPLVKPYVKSKVVPDRAMLSSSACEKCTLPDGKCVRWTFHLNNIVQNATFMCVQSVSDGELGLFEQEMPAGVLKKVLICNTDYCNGSIGDRIQPIILLYIMISLYSFFKAF